MVVNPPLGREIRRYPECAEKIREYMTCMSDQNSNGGVSRFAGSFISPCAPIQTEMNNCLVAARKAEQKQKNKERSAKMREKYKDFKNYEEPVKTDENKTDDSATLEKTEKSSSVLSSSSSIDKPVEQVTQPAAANIEKEPVVAAAAASNIEKPQQTKEQTKNGWFGGWFSK